MRSEGMTREISGGITMYRWRILAPWKDRLNAGITTRTGGISPPPFESLNLGSHAGDDQTNVQANRGKVAQFMNLPGSPWATAKQVHGCEIRRATEDFKKNEPSCDALYVSETRMINAIFLADCLPVVLYDPCRHVGAICHAGWKGTAAGIAGMAVDFMCGEGCRREDIVAAVGPGIGACCYPVGDEVAEVFMDSGQFSRGAIHGNRKTGYRVNLEAANRAVLLSAGLPDSRIGAAGFCTACRNREFFSYRKEGGHTGRHAATMALL